MKTVTIHDAKTNLSKYIAAAKRGEKIYIGGFGKPEVVLTTVKEQKRTGKRQLGIARGKVWVAPDAFSRETDEEIAREMYGEKPER